MATSTHRSSIRNIARRGACMAVLLAGAGLAWALPAAGVPARRETVPGPSRYHVRMLQVAPPRLAVAATLPIDGRELAMDTTRPGDIPEINERGWPALVSKLRVSDATGAPLQVTGAGPAGWLLEQPHSGPLTVEYEVDYSSLAVRAWPAPRETAFADADHFVLIGRSLFITTPEAGASDVTFDLPRGWQAVTPWERAARSTHGLAVESSGDLQENLLVFSRSSPDVMTAGGFRLSVTPMGHWQAARPEVRRVLGGVIQRLVALMGTAEPMSYSVVLLPIVDQGGESFRHSFALTVDAPPSRANSSAWGNTIAHEIFHLWNGWRLQGADYATSQWFQEGFTEYAANLSMVGAGLISPDELRKKLSVHVGNYRKLTTALEAGGTHKGPPLYSGGALVAFSWDVLIRQATGGRRSLGDFLRELWRQTGEGRRPYEWRDLRAALEATAPLDWQAFYSAHIRGTEPLPLGEILPQAGLRLEQTEDGDPRIEVDPEAPAPARALWQALVTGPHS